MAESVIKGFLILVLFGAIILGGIGFLFFNSAANIGCAICVGILALSAKFFPDNT